MSHHECGHFVLFKSDGIGFVDQHLGSIANGLGAHFLVLRMLRHLLDLDLIDSLDVDKHSVVLEQSRVTGRHVVDELLVDCPNLVPVHLNDRSRRALSHNELLERLDRHATPQDAAHRRETRIVPAAHFARVHEPRELAFGQHRVLQVQTRVLVDVRLAHAERLQKPHVLLVAIVILGCAKSVRYFFDAVHDWACKVIGWVHPCEISKTN